MSDLLRRPLTEITALLARRELSPVELMETTLDRIDAVNDKLGAFVAMRDRESILADARAAEARIQRGEARPLEGVPLGVKDLEDAAGLVTSARLARLPGQPRRARLDPGRAAARGRRDRRRQDQRARVRRHRDHQEPALSRGAQSVESRAHAGRIERRIVGGDRGFDDPARDRERRRRLRAHPRHLHRLLRSEAQLRPHPARARTSSG